jgi:muramoyltetrapeptide carboxypeptidase
MEMNFKEIKETIVPPHLSQGDDIRIIAPASAPDMKNLSKTIISLTKLGFKVSLGRNIRRLVQRNSLAAPLHDRATELMEAFKDDSVKAIFCARGGYGSIHVLPYLDYDVIREHPKIFVGYSDITALHMAFNKLSGLVTFHGPMPASDPNEFHKSSFKIVLDILSGRSSDISGFIEGVVKYIHRGKVEGKSMGTNISVAISLIGTPYMTSSENRILFAEDTAITSGDLDRYFSVLNLTGALEKFSGFAFGEFKQVFSNEEPMPYIEDIIQQYMDQFKKPSIFGLPFGHGEDQMLIPLNAKMALSSETPYVEIKESIVN